MPVDPQIQPILDLLASAGAPPIEEQSPDDVRASYGQMALMNGTGPEVASVEDRTIPGPSGAPEIPVRIYTPLGANGPFGILVWIHGGGWVIGDIPTADATCRSLCAQAGVVVVSVEYRLAPETPFPGAVDDCYAAISWAAANASALNADASRLAVGGDSAGGNLSAVMALKARDMGGPSLAFQLLVYPVTDCLLTHPSMEENADGYLLTKASMVWFTDHYLGAIGTGADRKDPYASPLYAGDLSGLPPALVITAEYDPLRDEGEAYAQRLSDAGVAATAHRYDGAIHGFFAMEAMVDQSRAAVTEAAQALRAAIG